MIRNHMIEAAAVSPDLKIADPHYNARQIIAAMETMARAQGSCGSGVNPEGKAGAECGAGRAAGIVVFPELSISGYTCADLFLNENLLQESEAALLEVAAATGRFPGLLAAVGVPVRFRNQLYNCAAFLSEGRIICLIPKINIPMYGEFYEGRWFSSGKDILTELVTIGGQSVPFGTHYLMEDADSKAVVGCEICEDLWVPDKPSSHAALAGANIIVNLSASDEVIGKEDFRRQMVTMQSAACYCGYVYASAGTWESSTDLVYSGHMMIAENGHLLADAVYPQRGEAVRAIFDMDIMTCNRVKMTTFPNVSSLSAEISAAHGAGTGGPVSNAKSGSAAGAAYSGYAGSGAAGYTGSSAGRCAESGAAGYAGIQRCPNGSTYIALPVHIAPVSGQYEITAKDLAAALKKRSYPVPRAPFVPSDPAKRRSRCEKILKIQANGLATRVRGTGIHNLVIGISGGLDSTLALIVAHAAKQIEPEIHIIAYTMPNRGNTTSRTYHNALELMRLLADEQRTVSIDESVALHLKEIGHSAEYQGEGDVAYENAQARMRTYILMDAANMETALVVGTGDLSELALGWCTYNGDHMSMYAVNSSVPKTLVQYIVKAYADTCAAPGLKEVLYSVCDTPITPELTPNREDVITQKTEEKIGRYDLNDFFLFYMLRYGMDCRKVYALAMLAYEGIDPEEIRDAEIRFCSRFFRQQFKRSCLPDGPKVGSVALSPRGDWRMPSDAAPDLWIRLLREE